MTYKVCGVTCGYCGHHDRDRVPYEYDYTPTLCSNCGRPFKPPTMLAVELFELVKKLTDRIKVLEENYRGYRGRMI